MNFVTPLHQSTKRDYLARMIDDKVACMHKAKEYEQKYLADRGIPVRIAQPLPL